MEFLCHDSHQSLNIAITCSFSFLIFNICHAIFVETEHRHHSVRIHVCSGACRVGQPGLLGSNVLPGRSAADPTTIPPSV